MQNYLLFHLFRNEAESAVLKEFWRDKKGAPLSSTPPSSLSYLSWFMLLNRAYNYFGVQSHQMVNLFDIAKF